MIMENANARINQYVHGKEVKVILLFLIYYR